MKKGQQPLPPPSFCMIRCMSRFLLPRIMARKHVFRAARRQGRPRSIQDVCSGRSRSKYPIQVCGSIGIGCRDKRNARRTVCIWQSYREQDACRSCTGARGKRYQKVIPGRLCQSDRWGCSCCRACRNSGGFRQSSLISFTFQKCLISKPGKFCAGS